MSIYRELATETMHHPYNRILRSGKKEREKVLYTRRGGGGVISYCSVIPRAAPSISPQGRAQTCQLPMALCAGSTHPILELGRQKLCRRQVRNLNYAPKRQLSTVRQRSTALCAGLESDQKTILVPGRGSGPSFHPSPYARLGVTARDPPQAHLYLSTSRSTDGKERSCKQMSCLHLFILLGRVWMALLVQGRQGRVLRCLYGKGQKQGRQTDTESHQDKTS